ncbi:MAG: hypothetical protein RI967_2023, partial [Planctomycetota bacterium]
EALDSTTLFRCADGMEVVARLRGLQGHGSAEREAVEAANALRESAERFKSDEQAATGEDPSQ